MLNMYGQEFRLCDGVTRRDVLAAGAVSLGGLTLADLLRAEDRQGIRHSEKAVINVHLDGGPPQMDMIDLKPQAPVEIRGEFSPIATQTPGIQIGELLPKLAGISDKLVLLRTLVGSAGRHDAFQCQSGFDFKNLESLGGRPALGSVVAKLRGRSSDTAPSFVDMMQGRALVRNSARPGFLGPAFAPFRPDLSSQFTRELEQGMKGELARQGANHTTSLTLNPELSLPRLHSRTDLLTGLDRLRREADQSGMMEAMDSFTQQAMGILTSGQFAAAMDLSQEDPRMLRHYAFEAGASGGHTTSDGANATLKFLYARRLIEAGVRCVSLSISDFDTHSGNFPRLRQILPLVDHGLYALITDLDQRGMLGDVSIVVWGEFGRTPRIDTKTGGRHHWPRVGMGLLAGGGMKTGQVIGETDREAGSVVSRPVSYQDVFATLYHNLGIDTDQITIQDPSGRPQYLVDGGHPLREVI